MRTYDVTQRTNRGDRATGVPSGAVRMSRRIRCALVLISTLLLSGAAFAAEIRVMASGAFTAAYLALIPRCGESVGDSIVTVTTTMGVGATSIPSRLERGEAVDVVIVDRDALTDMATRGWIAPASRMDLARSAIAMAVRAGAAKPNITTVEALRHTLLSAQSIAYSASVSGDYLSKELFQRLGVADQVLPKSRPVVGERVGTVVARLAAERWTFARRTDHGRKTGMVPLLTPRSIVGMKLCYWSSTV